MDQSKKWAVSEELQETVCCEAELSYDELVAMGFSEKPDSTVLVDSQNGLLAFLYGGCWQVLGTGGL